MATSMGKYLFIYKVFIFIVRTILEAIISFLPTPGEGAIGSLDYPAEERRRLAKLSVDYECPKCGKVADLLPPLNKDEFKLTYGNVISELSAKDPGVIDESILKEHEDADENDKSPVIHKENESPLSESIPNENTSNSTKSPEISQPPPPSIPSTSTIITDNESKSELRHRNITSSNSNTNSPSPNISSLSPPPPQQNENQNHHVPQFVQQINTNQQQQNAVEVNNSSVVDQMLSYVIYLFYVIIALILLKKTSRKFF